LVSSDLIQEEEREAAGRSLNYMKLCPAPHHAGPRWRSWVFFGVETWNLSRTQPLVLHGWCSGCKAAWARQYNARRMAGARAGVAEDVAWLENRRRTNREANIVRERKNGAVPRAELGGGGRRYVKPAVDHKQLRSPVIFSVLEDWVESAERSFHDYDGGPWGYVKDTLGETSAAWRRVREARGRGYITIDALDKICTRLGYPDAVEDLHRAAS
jgi:hypothetical protein